MPLPMISKFSRCFLVESDNRHDHASGTLIVLPSSRSVLNNEFEAGLVKTIGLFDIQVKDTANNLSPKVIAKYCYNLAVSFNAFYEHVRVLDSGDESLVNARLCLVFSFKSTLGNALNLLGIPSPERM